MKGILRFTQALVLLALIVGCSGIPVAETPTVEPTRTGLPPLSDLVATSMTIMEGDGIRHEYLDYTPMILVKQGATMLVTAIVFIDNSLTDGEDSFDRDRVEVRFEANLIQQGDLTDPDAESSYLEVIEYEDVPPSEAEVAYGTLHQPVVMDYFGVKSGLVENGLLNADAYSFPDNFNAAESLTDYVLAENEPTTLKAADPEIVEDIMLEQLPRIRYFTAGGDQGANNHLMPIQQYYVDFTVDEEAYERHFPWIVFTFEMGTAALQNGDWEVTVQVDHNNEITEVDESNNDLIGHFTIHLPETDWAPIHDTWWEEQWATDYCDPWAGQTAPTKFDSKVIRVRHHIGSHPWYEETQDFGFWAQQGMAKVLRTQMYVTEFWGPHGSGRQYIDGNWVEYYDDMGGDLPRPAPEDVENVFLFLAGNGGCRTAGTTIATGQGNYYCNFTGNKTWKYHELRIESWPGQLVYKWPNYDMIYTPSNSLLVMAYQHVGTAGYSSRVQRQNAEGFLALLRERTGGFKKVRTVWLGGNSRGGAVAVRLARMLKRKMVEGAPFNLYPEDMQIIVTSADGVTLTDRDDLYYHSMKYICRGTCWDVQTHELDKAFPYHQDPEQSFTNNLFIYQSVGSAAGLDSFVQHYHDNYSNWRNWVITEGLPGNFYTQNMEGFVNAISHKEMCRTWKQITAINHIQFFFSKAIDKWGNPWDLNFIPYPDGCP
jgi:hypothetical protein